MRVRAALPLAGMLLVLVGGAAAPARAATTIINTPVSGPITVNAGDRLEIHTGGHVSSSSTGVIVNAGGELVVFDGAVLGGYGGSDEGGNCGVELNGGTLTVAGGSVDGRTGLIVNGGTASLAGGSVHGITGTKVTTGSVTIPGSAVQGNQVGVELTGGTVTVSGGAVSGLYYGVIVNGGAATVSSGSVSGNPGVLVNSGQAIVSGGTIGGGTIGVTVSGGTASFSGGSVSGFNIGVDIEGGAVAFSGGAISSGSSGVLIDGGTATLSGSSFYGDDYGVEITGGTVGISGGSFSGGVNSIFLAGGMTSITGCNLETDTMSGGIAIRGILQNGSVIDTFVATLWPAQLEITSANTYIQCPADQTVTATSAAGAVVHYPPPTVGNTCGPVQVTSVPASGSTFPVGTTPVKCTITDALGNSRACKFTVTVLPVADLSVLMTAASGNHSGNPLRVKVGETLTYTIVVNNRGPHAAESVVVQDILPASFVFQSAATTQGTLQTPPSGGTGTLTASLGSLAVGGSATVRITGSFSQRKATNPNTASVSAGTTDPNPANNQATVTVIVN